MRNFISASDVEDIDALITSALSHKARPFHHKELGKNKRIGLLFLNPSMRTRLSTQIAASNLGMDATVFNVGQDGWTLEFLDGAVMNGTTVEHVRDAAPVLGQYFDILGVRSFPSLKNKEEDYSELYLRQFIKYAGIPVVSLESATLHPLQSLTDLVTISEVFPSRSKKKIVLTWAPHIKALPQCVANSFSQWMTAWGEVEFVIANPSGYELDAAYTKGATITHDQSKALEGADIVYVKNWSSCRDYGKVELLDPSWMLTSKKLEITNQARIMHCLPVRRNVELSDEVLDGSKSLVTQQAGNRVWAAQAVLAEILKTL